MYSLDAVMNLCSSPMCTLRLGRRLTYVLWEPPEVQSSPSRQRQRRHQWRSACQLQALNRDLVLYKDGQIAPRLCSMTFPWHLPNFQASSPAKISVQCVHLLVTKWILYEAVVQDMGSSC